MASNWRVKDGVAELRHERLSANVDLECPLDGICDAGPSADICSSGMRLFQLRLGESPKDRESPSDSYVRAEDLVVTYAQTEARHFSAEVYWRALCEEQTAPCGFEVIVSARTDTLDAHPEITSQSDLAQSAAFSLRDVDNGEFVPMVGSALLGADDAAGCFLFRFPETDVSYVEAVHPTDYCNSELIASGTSWRVRHSVINRWMEKGVIVRARMRGLYVAREDDFAIAARAFREFAAAKVPLTT